MTASFTFELVAPEKLLASKAVALVTVPGGDGDYGVLPDHAPMITTLRAGVISVCENTPDTVTEKLFVAGGFAEVTADRFVVLAEEAVPFSDLNAEQLDAAATSLAASLTQAKTDDERAALQKQITLNDAKRDALRGNG